MAISPQSQPSPYVTNGASGTAAAPVTATFSTKAQTIILSATVFTTAGIPIDGGTETFTILNGTTVIGQTTVPTVVSNGNVMDVLYNLPTTPAGQYIIEASYSGTTSYLPATDTLHFLTVLPAGTTTTTVSAAATYSAISDQTLALSARSAAAPANPTKASSRSQS